MKTLFPQHVRPATVMVGRILLALIFVLSGWNKVMHYSSVDTYMASVGIPMAGALLPLTILVELGGGLLIAVGLFTRAAAIVVFLFSIPVTLAIHHFWDLPAAQAMMQQIHFMKNVSMMGGMLLLAVYGAGSWSLDGEIIRLREEKMREMLEP